MASGNEKGQKRRVASRLVFVAKVKHDQELDTVVGLAASALRVRKSEMEATLEYLLSQFDQLLTYLVKAQDTLYVVGAFDLTDRQRRQVYEVWAAEYSVARDFLIANFGEEVRGYADDLIDRRVLQLRNGTA